MKKINFIWIALAALTLWTGCTKDEAGSISSNELADYYRKSLPNDPVFIEMATAYDRFIALGIESHKQAPSVNKRNELMNKFQSVTDEQQALALYKEEFTNSGEMIKVMQRKQLLSDRFRKENEKFFTLAPTVRQDVLVHVVSQIEYPVRKEDTNLLSFFTAKAEPSCMELYNIDKGRCTRNGRIGAVGCGLLSETIVLAFVCGGFVILNEEVCLQDAQVDYENCLKQ